MHAKARQLHAEASSQALACEEHVAKLAQAESAASAAAASLDALHDRAAVLLSIGDTLAEACTAQDHALLLRMQHFQSMRDMHSAAELAAVAGKRAQLLQQSSRHGDSAGANSEQQCQPVNLQIEEAHAQNAAHVQRQQTAHKLVEQLARKVKCADGLLHICLLRMSTLQAKEDAVSCAQSLQCQTAQADMLLRDEQNHQAELRERLQRITVEQTLILQTGDAAGIDSTAEAKASVAVHSEAPHALEADIVSLKEKVQALEGQLHQGSEQTRNAEACVQLLSRIASVLHKAACHQSAASEGHDGSADWQEVQLDASRSQVPRHVILTLTAQLCVDEASLCQDALAALTAFQSSKAEIASLDNKILKLTADRDTAMVNVDSAKHALADAHQGLACALEDTSDALCQGNDDTGHAARERILQCETHLRNAEDKLASLEEQLCAAETEHRIQSCQCQALQEEERSLREHAEACAAMCKHSADLHAARLRHSQARRQAHHCQHEAELAQVSCAAAELHKEVLAAEAAVDEASRTAHLASEV